MRNKFLIVVIAGCLMSSTAFAATNAASKEENIGVGTGAIVGALAGGPVGLFIGAAIGAKLGEKYHKRSETLAGLNQSLEGSQQTIANLEGDVVDLNGEISDMGDALQELQDVSRPELLQLMQAGIEMDLLFRTDEDVLSETTGDRLQQLAGSLASMPDIYVQLDGFADERGDATYNQQLSIRRAEFVRDTLLAAGVSAARISISAHGESPASDTNADSYALERRVSLTLYIEDAPSFAANP